MKKYGIYYGSQTGTTEDVAKRIARKLGVDTEDIHNVSRTAPETLGDYDVLVMGTSTWGAGEIEDDWYDFLDGASALYLKGKKLAVFGCGDESMTDTFCNGVGELYRRMRETGVTPIAPYTAAPFEFNHSDAVIDGECVGLLLDEVNHADLTDARIDAWTDLIRNS